MLQISERIILTIWIGGMWTVGYLVAPTLFNMLEERAMAGSIAGRLFTVMSYVGLVSVILLMSSLLYSGGMQALQAWRSWLLLGMLVIIVIGEFVLQPKMSALREAGLQADNAKQFAVLHGSASVLFLINSLAGLALVIFGLRSQA
jgi:uncharacterized membrane protein